MSGVVVVRRVSVGVGVRGLVSAGVVLVATVAHGATASVADVATADAPDAVPPPQSIVQGLVIERAPEPEPSPQRARARRPQLGPERDPLALAVEAQQSKGDARPSRRRARPELPTSMDVRMVQANILSRMGPEQFVADLREATAGAPDFVTLNEAVRAPELVALPGYAFHRGTDSRWAMETTLMWRADRWEALSTGTRYLHRRGGTWGVRAVNWGTLRSLETGGVVSVVSTHASPVGKGTPDLLPVYVGALATLVGELSAQGPVFAGGDLNVHYGSGRFPRAGLQAGGLAPTYDVHGIPPGGTGDHAGHTIDYLLFQPGAGVTSTSQWTMELFSDHDAVAGDFRVDW